ncbi:microtubule-associated tumor suppressor 1 homolog isoform X2 [Danio aesculapii]|uniref:microtubule-associated tumor suppressor 1 homolog isoform X2 n=1 Tax=Danio aesculapii TaxID=1142201 RepID=UPI0024BFE6D9|nr:microtubule-associated tumor suppressor 1 homolog isoform X2 [Danio aesculapii]
MIKSQSLNLMEPPINTSELPPPALPNRPQHELCLPLHSNEHNNIAFTSESSTLSSSSISLLYDRGETSPDSVRSLSSLSSARTDSPLDVDMPEAEMGKVMANSDDSGIQSPDCRPDYAEDNDNSVSVYLDANEDCWSDNDNHNVTSVVSQKVSQTDGDDTSLCSSETGDDDTKDEEEEDSFLSLVSVEVMMKNQAGVSALEVSTVYQVEIPNTDLQVTSEGLQSDVSEGCLLNETNREVVYEKGEVSVAIQEIYVVNETIALPESSDVINVSSFIKGTRSILKDDIQQNSDEHQEDVSNMDVVFEPNGEVVHEKGEDSVESLLAIQDMGVMKETVVYSESSETNEVFGLIADDIIELPLAIQDIDVLNETVEANMEVVHEKGDSSIESIQETNVINETMVSTENKGTKNAASSLLKEDCLPKPKDQPTDKFKMAAGNESNREVVHKKGETSNDPIPFKETIVSPKNSQANKTSSAIIGTKKIASPCSKDDNQPKVNGQQSEMATFIEPNMEAVHEKRESSVESIQETNIINESMESPENPEDNNIKGTKNAASSVLKEDNQPKSKDQPESLSKMAAVNESNKEAVHKKGEASVDLISLKETMASPENPQANKTSTSLTGTKKVASSFSKEDNQPKSTAKKTNDLPGHVLVKPTQTKATKPEAKRFPRPDLRNVKAKIISRAASSPRSANPPKTNTVQSGSVKVHESRKVEDKAVGKRSRSSSNHTRVSETRTCSSAEVASSGGRENDANTLSLPTQGGETTMKSESASSTDFKDEGVPQLDKETSKSPSKTVSSKLGPSLGTCSTSSSGSPEGRPKTSNRPTGSLGPAGGRVLQPAGIPRMRNTDRPTVPSSPPSVSSSPCKAPQRTASSKLPVKGLPTSSSSSSPGSTISESNSTAVNKVLVEVPKSEEKSLKQSPTSQTQVKSLVSKPASGHRSRASSTPTKPAAGLKAPAVINHVTTKNNQNALHRSGSTRLMRSSSVAVDKSSKGSKAAVPTAGRTPQHSATGQAGPVEEEEEREDLSLQNEKKSQCILHLRKLIANGNRRLEALALVVQHIFSEREVAIKQREELSVQINNLREQLSNSVSCCEQLEKEKEEVRVTLEALFQKLQEQHQSELQQLEKRLKDFYSAEWDKTHEAYQREADKCRALMQQQVEDVRYKQEALRKQQEVAHTEQIATLKHVHETSVTELKKAHDNDMQELDKTLKESEAMLNEKIETLTAENEALKERLTEEQEWRRAVADKAR